MGRHFKVIIEQKEVAEANHTVIRWCRPKSDDASLYHAFSCNVLVTSIENIVDAF
jgi:hypothetical protein